MLPFTDDEIADILAAPGVLIESLKPTIEDINEYQELVAAVLMMDPETLDNPDDLLSGLNTLEASRLRALHAKLFREPLDP